MDSLLAALRSKEGRVHLCVMAVGIVVACLGGFLFKDAGIACDIAVIAGSGISMVAVDQFCRLVIRLRGDDGE